MRPNALLDGYGRLIDDPKGLRGRDRALAGDGLAAGRQRLGRSGRYDRRRVRQRMERRRAVTDATRRSVGHYVLAYADDPSRCDETHTRAPSRMLLWHCNYHPDGGQLFLPRSISARSSCRWRLPATM
jgi:ureidoglycolate lyase/seryl-tRNA synthetase